MHADVLVIGGGGAAARAAIEADKANAGVIMATKGILETTGTTMSATSSAMAYSAAFPAHDPRNTVEKHFQDIIEVGAHVCDRTLARIIAEEAPERLLDLERLGRSFRTPRLRGC